MFCWDVPLIILQTKNFQIVKIMIYALIICFPVGRPPGHPREPRGNGTVQFFANWEQKNNTGKDNNGSRTCVDNNLVVQRWWFPFKTAKTSAGDLLSFPTCQFCQYVKSIDFLSLFIDFCTRKAVKRAAGLCAQHSVTILAMVRRSCGQNNNPVSYLKNGKERRPLHM